MENNNLKLSSPWICFYNEVEAMFKWDPDVTVKLEQTADNFYFIKLFVNNNNKADALYMILEKKKTFGDVTVEIEIIPENPVNKAPVTELFEIAFEDNPALYDVIKSENIFGTFNYIVFDKSVVQYKNDDIGDLHGVKSTLYEAIAKDIFKEDLAAHYCTSTDDSTLL